MITKPTVLILGAGASAPYEFPMGEELWEILCNDLQSGYLHDFLLSNGFNADDILSFRDNLFESGKISIDAFLEHRKEFLKIGKLAIATVLTKYEDGNILFNSGKGKWYKYLFDKINSPSFEKFSDNKISIITFNYDRSFEHFLFNSVQKSYGKSDEECAVVISKIPIIHLHGRLGYLPWQNKNGRHYKKDNSKEDIIKSADEIKIIHEDIDRDSEFLEARERMKEAERIYILGFGYNEINVQRLGIRDLMADGKKIIGTAKGFMGQEFENKKKICNNKVVLPNVYDDSLDFLRGYAEFD